MTTGFLTDNASYSYDANDRLQSVTDGPKVVTYGWDANGNQTEETDSLTGVTREFVWNDRDRLAAVFDDGAHVASYGYDHGANRVSREAGGVVTRFLVDLNNLTGYSQVARETDAPAGAAPGDPPTGPFTETVRYTYGDDLLAQIRADVLPTADPVSFYHYDGLGSVRALTDSLAGVADSYTYEAFGSLLASTPSATAPVNVYLYTGERLDAETGLYHLRARQYGTYIGRMLSLDTHAGFGRHPASLNKYIYVGANPIVQIDPSGRVALAVRLVAWSFVLKGALLGAVVIGVKGPGFNVAAGTNLSSMGKMKMLAAQRRAATCAFNSAVDAEYAFVDSSAKDRFTTAFGPVTAKKRRRVIDVWMAAYWELSSKVVYIYTDDDPDLTVKVPVLSDLKRQPWNIQWPRSVVLVGPAFFYDNKDNESTAPKLNGQGETQASLLAHEATHLIQDGVYDENDRPNLGPEDLGDNYQRHCEMVKDSWYHY